jgi:ABC-type transport system involved in multi-copper enzyme maturation permease subunit
MIRLFKYEFIRITSLRSSWVLTILGTLMVCAISYLAISTTVSTTNGDLAALAFSDLVPAFVPIWGIWAATLASQAFGHDYRHGTIRLTLSAFPNRFAVYFVRVTTVLIWCTLWLATTAAIVILEGKVLLKDGIDLSQSSGAIGRASIFFLLFILSAIAIVMITRVMALGTVVPLMMASVVENLVAFFIPQSLEWTAEYYPYSRAMAWTMPWNVDGSENAYPLAVFTVIALLIAGAMFVKRDA